ncbi:MAG: AlpA family transcriptional regulator [Candidatus Nealsonbacteria bacterium CG11_big_fil_rev_8_21_14_0_20_35_11]|uniref:AlpA family transcriptional regulator n=1 Tax=Candidatus Nealsonbacteria bacterium CG11_big_fil_rev_8_21_14_0_20_35_11 TaxID=1974713 RepID=A0A2H0N1M8_9BACT|nr:MAG: AlpA family transcriptional regulator [Candidatus Nealsonbacteria bacterium CG11_big_fil_rev_8_21_14_0_20_35_11]
MNKLLTPKQVANKLGVSEFTIWRYIKAKKLKAIKLTERNFRIEEKDLIQFLKKHKTK